MVPAPRQSAIAHFAIPVLQRYTAPPVLLDFTPTPTQAAILVPMDRPTVTTVILEVLVHCGVSIVYRPTTLATTQLGHVRSAMPESLIARPVKKIAPFPTTSAAMLVPLDIMPTPPKLNVFYVRR